MPDQHADLSLAPLAGVQAVPVSPRRPPRRRGGAALALLLATVAIAGAAPTAWRLREAARAEAARESPIVLPDDELEAALASAAAALPVPPPREPWRTETAGLGASVACLLLLLLLGLAASTRRARVEEELEAERAIHAREEARLAAEAAAEALRHRRELIAQEGGFAAVLESVSHGIVTFGRHARLSLVNARCAELLGFPLEALRPGATLPELVAAARRAGQPGAAAVLERLLPLVVRREPASFVQDFVGGGAVLVVHRPLANGGWMATFEDIGAQRIAAMQLDEAASRDALTGLPHRAELRTRLAELLRAANAGGGRTAMLHLGLDRFRMVNEALGDRVGDALLRAVAGRIARLVRLRRGSDLVARIGADEFAVVTAPVFGTRGDAAAEAAGIAERLVHALSTPFEVDGYRVITGASVGIALFPASGGNAEELLRNAGLAMHGAKAAGGGRHLFYEPEMGAQIHARRLLELDLRFALAGGTVGAFELRYAPVVDVLSGRAAVLEAIPCWQHPIHGELAAEILVPLAAELGLTVPLGRLLLKRACAELKRWPGPLRVALGVTTAELLDPGLEEAVAGALAAAGIEPHRFELQLPEAELLMAPEPALEALHRLRALGVRVTLDGFAATAEVLTHLRAFPFDKLRLNRSFSRELAGRGAGVEVPRAVIALCGRLGIPAAAEGIETEDQLRALAVERCLQATGPVFGAPVVAEGVPALLTRLEMSAAAARGVRLPEMPAGE